MTGEAHHYTTLSGGLPTIKPESSCPESSVPFSSDRIFRVYATSHLAQVQMAKRRDPTPALPCTPPSQPPLGDSPKGGNGHPASYMASSFFLLTGILWDFPPGLGLFLGKSSRPLSISLRPGGR